LERQTEGQPVSPFYPRIQQPQPVFSKDCDIAVQLAEYTRIIPTDEENTEPLKLRLLLIASTKHLRRGIKTLKVSGRKGDGWVQLDFRDGE